MEAVIKIRSNLVDYVDIRVASVDETPSAIKDAKLEAIARARAVLNDATDALIVPVPDAVQNPLEPKSGGKDERDNEAQSDEDVTPSVQTVDNPPPAPSADKPARKVRTQKAKK